MFAVASLVLSCALAFFSAECDVVSVQVAPRSLVQFFLAVGPTLVPKQ